MKPHLFAAACCVLALPVVAPAATRTYDVGSFDAISASAGIDVEVRVGPVRSVVAETESVDFADLEITVEDNALHVGRPRRSWFSSGTRPRYKVRIVTPAVQSLQSSSGAEISVAGPLRGDLSVSASSGSEISVSDIQGGNVKARASSGAGIDMAGQCGSLDAQGSSGADIDAKRLTCGAVTVKASSGSDVSVAPKRNFDGQASSGADVRIEGAPPVMRTRRSSGAGFDIGE